MAERKYNNHSKQRIVAVLCAIDSDSSFSAEDSLDELERLADTAGAETIARVLQPREKPDGRTYLGKGKVKELADFIDARKESDDEVGLVIFDDELTPSQLRNLEDDLNCRVIDRTMLILDIFASRAKTAEGKLQVEIACLRYTAPRLVGKGTELSRLAGGIGTRGPGESQLETDRRHLKRRIAALEKRISDLERTRDVQRNRRNKSGIKVVAIIGYTNAGKSTLMNALTDANIFAEDKLFATLDPTTRSFRLSSGKEILLTDTVGFVNRLPHHLIKAFKSTLEEVKHADAIIELIDASESDDVRQSKIEVTENLLQELDAVGKPIVKVYNKSDIEVDEDFIPRDAIRISAKTGQGINSLLEALEKI